MCGILVCPEILIASRENDTFLNITFFQREGENAYLPKTTYILSVLLYILYGSTKQRN